jgi:hypothetical protein
VELNQSENTYGAEYQNSSKHGEVRKNKRKKKKENDQFQRTKQLQCVHMDKERATPFLPTEIDLEGSTTQAYSRRT